MQVKDFYDDIAEEYNNLRYGKAYYKRIAQLELDFIQKHLKWGSCLEVGAGTGRVTEFLLKNTKHVMAVDISPRMLERLKRDFSNYTNLATKVHDVYELQQIEEYGNFDCTVCLRVLSHLENPLAALKQLRGAIVRDGIAVFDMWNAWGYDALAKRLKLRSLAVYTRYISAGQMRSIIEKASLSIIDRRGFGFPPFRVFLPLEKSSLSQLDFLSQRILWVCRPITD